jgi:hypothetical protein
MEMAYKYLITAILIAICCAPMHAANATENDPGIWTIFSTTDSFPGDEAPSRWHYWFDAQARYFDPGSGANQWLIRPGIGYEIRSGIKVWAGYARLRSRNSAGRVADENRYWQQVDWRAGQVLGGRVIQRVRLEQRSINTGDDLRVVLRFMTKYVRPISTDGDASLIVSLEPFFDLNDTDWGGDSGIAQNRTFVGAGRRVSSKLTLEAGYLNQYIFADSAENRVNHLAVLTIKAKF